MTHIHCCQYSIQCACLALLSALACTPLRDLDAAAAGFDARNSAGGARASGSSAGGNAGGASSDASAGAGVAGASSAAAGAVNPSARGGGSNAETPGFDVGGAGTPANLEAGGAPSEHAGATASAGTSPAQAGAAPVTLADLPNDLNDSPVSGDVSWLESNYSGQATFDVLTPTARYSVLRDAGSIISILDQTSSDQAQWIGYSSYRPRRAAGIVSAEQPVVTTTLDANSATARHVRLRCRSALGDWVWVWDFYATQATLTIARAPSAFGFGYRGTPGQKLADDDELVLASGQMRSAKGSFAAALTGPSGWAYLTDSDLGHALFLIQHQADTVPDDYDALDGDSATLVFGGGTLTQLPLRFSLGIVGNDKHAVVASRAKFVIDALASVSETAP